MCLKWRLKLSALLIVLYSLCGCQEQISIESENGVQGTLLQDSTSKWDERLWLTLQQDSSFVILKEIARRSAVLKNVYPEPGSDSVAKQVRKTLLVDLRHSISCRKVLSEKYSNYSSLYIYKFIADSLSSTSQSKVDVIGNCEYAMNHFQNMLYYVSYLVDSYVMLYGCTSDDAEYPVRNVIQCESVYPVLWNNDNFWSELYDNRNNQGIVTCEMVSAIEIDYISPANTYLTAVKDDLYRIVMRFQADPYGFFVDSSYGVGSPSEEIPENCDHEKCVECGGCLMNTTIACEECTCPTLTLTLSSSIVTINGSVTLTAIGESNTACIFEVLDGSEWKILATVNGFTYTFTPKVSGFWKLRVRQSFYSRNFKSEEKILEVRYPSYGDIITNSSIRGVMNTLWETTKNYASSAGVKEYGAWIYWDSETLTYDFQYCEGENIPIGDSVYMIVPFQDSSLIRKPTSVLGNEKTAVAFFHTHTPLTYYSSSFVRSVGPSDIDTTALLNLNMVGIVYDYMATMGEYIVGGHSKDASATLFHVGLVRRPTRRE